MAPKIMTPEETRELRARWLFNYLDRHGLGPGCHDWDGLAPEGKRAYIDAMAHLEDIMGAH
jgi:hypothetical protein